MDKCAETKKNPPSRLYIPELPTHQVTDKAIHELVSFVSEFKLDPHTWVAVGGILQELGLFSAAARAYRRASLLDWRMAGTETAEDRAYRKWGSTNPKWVEDLFAVPKASVSACIIARNEGEYIGECIKHLVSAVDEVVVIDSGSQDDTAQIAAALGAKVLRYNWEDDFSAARNFALSQVASQWVFFVDADEFLDDQDVEHVRETAGLFHGTKSMLRVIQVNQVGDEVFYNLSNVRLLPTQFGLCWEGRTHERVVLPPAEDAMGWQRPVIRIRLHHRGYDPHLEGTAIRLQRNVKLLREVVGEHPEDIGAWSALGQALFRLQRYEQAIECFDTVEMLSPQYPEYGHLTEARVTLARALMELERWLEAIGVLERSLQNEPDYPSSHFYLGQAKMQLALHLLTEARESFANSQTLVNVYQGQSAYDANIGKWKAACGIADTQKYQGHMIQAYEGYRKIREANPDHEMLQRQMLLLELQAKEIVGLSGKP
ncbi:glycosyltransferase [Alicyclobacillus tolerans]|uniref:glycosyltransferase n=1 Tax=Alicyclobacillus tolerans TaxID=90970 RepID=UPI001F233F0A|nr:glycosyltransferase [Alicyclobacillus tolerans]MCF8568488.1 glycosyltransferase [Alicyclobacillus tolerans]